MANLDDLPDAMTPTEVVEAYVQAWDEAHYRAYQWLTTSALNAVMNCETREDFERVRALYPADPGRVSMLITHVDVHGDSATVDAAETVLDGDALVTQTLRYRLERDEESWVVDSAMAVGD